MHHESLEPLAIHSFEDVEQRFGNWLYHWHRVELHQTLRDHATLPNPQARQPGSVSLSKAITNVDCDKGIIFLEDGQQIQKDLLIIADGHKVR